MLANSSCGGSTGTLARHKLLFYIESQVLEFLKKLSKLEKDEFSETGFSAFRLRQTARSMFVWSRIYSSSHDSKIIMKRDLYYANPELFKSQSVTDRIVSDLARNLLVNHRSMSVVASPKGLVHGPVSWKDMSSDSTHSAEGVTKLIPTDFDGLSSDCSAVLVIEKESVFHTICSTGIATLMNCVLVTAKGYPDNQTRDFVRALSRNNAIPILVMTDCDPHGIAIFLCFRNGSQSNLFHPILSCTWIGVKLSDIGSDQLLLMTETDQSLATSLLQSLESDTQPNLDCVKKELDAMINKRAKAEMEALIGGYVQFSSLTSYLFQLISSNMVDESSLFLKA